MTSAEKRGRRFAMSGADSRLRNAAAGSLAVSLLGTGGRFLLQVVMAQALGTAAYGLFVTLRGWGELLAILPNAGYQGAAVRFLPEYEATSKWGNYRALLWQSFRLTVVASTVVAVVGTVVGVIATGNLGLSLLVAMATIPAWAGLRMLQAILQAQHKFVPASFIVQVGQPVALGVALGIWWLFKPSLGSTGALTLLLVSIVVSVVVATRSTATGIPEPVNTATSEADLALWRPAAREFFIGQIAIAVLGMADLLILAMFADPTEVALYAIATRLSLLGRLVNSGVESIVAPRISTAWTNRDTTSIQRAVDESIALSTIPTVLFGIALVIFRSPVLGIVGEEYKAAGTAMTILLVGNVFGSLTGPCGYVVSLTGNEATHARIMLAAAGLLTVLCFAVAGPAGIVGVALARMFSTAAWNTGLAVYARRTLGVRCYPTAETLRQWAAAARLPGR